MPTKRMTMLAKILEEERLHKIAQEAVAPEIGGEVSQDEADKLAEQIFDQLFEESIQDIGK